MTKRCTEVYSISNFFFFFLSLQGSVKKQRVCCIKQRTVQAAGNLKWRESFRSTCAELDSGYTREIRRSWRGIKYGRIYFKKKIFYLEKI